MAPQEKFTKESFWQSLETVGEKEVRLLHSLGRYGGDKRGLVENWLHKQHEARNEASKAEQIRAARSANIAAWVAAIAAIVAAIAAIISLYPIFAQH